MKKSYLLAIAVAAMAFAVNMNAQVSVGAGYKLESLTSKTILNNNTVKEDPTNLSGFYVGGSYNWEFISKSWGALSLQPELTYSFFSKKVESVVQDGMKGNVFLKDHYLDVPVNVKYSYDVLPSLKISAFAGPVFSFGLACESVIKVQSGEDHLTMRQNVYNGKTITKGNLNGKTINEKDKVNGLGYSIFDLKFGVGLAATVIDRIDIRAGYNFGLLNRAAKMKDDLGGKFVSRTNVFVVGLAYNF